MSSRASDTLLRLPALLGGDTARIASAEDEVLRLFDNLRDPLLRYVRAFGLEVGDAEDLVQDTFLALFNHLRRGGDRSNLRGWLFRVAHNLALKRRTGRRHEHVSFDAGTFTEPLAAGQNPEECLSDRERRRRAMAVLRALPERDRSCVDLRGQGLRYREIAEALGMSLGAVAKCLTRALARMQRAAER